MVAQAGEWTLLLQILFCKIGEGCDYVVTGLAKTVTDDEDIPAAFESAAESLGPHSSQLPLLFTHLSLSLRPKDTSMSNFAAPTLPPGPTCRSNIQLQSIIHDLIQKEVLLGKHEKSLVPTKPVTVIEYDSLKFEETLDTVKSIRQNHKLGNHAHIADGPNCNKIGYKNAGLWSPRSIHLEQLMKPLLSSSVGLWPDYETINEMLSKTDLVSDEQLQFAMVDTLLVRMNEANEVRYGFDRLYSHWSYSTNQFEMRKVL